MKSDSGSVVKKNQITVFVVSTNEYADVLKDITIAVSNTCKKICYVSMNKPYTTLISVFKEAKIDTKRLILNRVRHSCPRYGQKPDSQ